MYQDLLGRNPIAGENTTLDVNAIPSATNSIQRLRASIIAGTAYFNSRGNGTTTGFLNALYSDLLGRPGSTAPTSFVSLYGNAVGSAAQRLAVAQQLLGVITTAPSGIILPSQTQAQPFIDQGRAALVNGYARQYLGGEAVQFNGAPYQGTTFSDVQIVQVIIGTTFYQSLIL